MTICFGKEPQLVYCACISSTFINVCVCASFPLGFDDMIVIVPDHCLFFIFNSTQKLISYYLPE